MTNGCETGHWTQTWSLGVTLVIGREVCRIWNSKNYLWRSPNHLKTNPNHFLSIPIHKPHQNYLQIRIFHQYSSNNQKPQFQNSKHQMLKLCFLNKIIHFQATLRPIYNNLSIEKRISFPYLFKLKRWLCEEEEGKEETLGPRRKLFSTPLATPHHPYHPNPKNHIKTMKINTMNFQNCSWRRKNKNGRWDKKDEGSLPWDLYRFVFSFD